MRRVTSARLGGVLSAFPPMLLTLMLVTLGIWVVQLLSSPWQPRGQEWWSILALQTSDILGRGFVWQFLTYQFLHDPVGIMHVAFNLYALWLFGRELEPRWGRWAFLRYYLTCGVGAGALHVLLSWLLLPQHDAMVIGASGAVLGVLVAYAMIWPRRQLLFAFVFPIEVRFLVILIAAIELILAWRGTSGAANLAHLGGMLTGWLYLKHGWRLARPGRFGDRVRLWWGDLRRRRQRRHIRAVDDGKEWEAWLREEVDDETRH